MRNAVSSKLDSVVDSDADARAAKTDSGVRVVQASHDTHRVELWGPMPVGWLGNFTRGVTRMKLDIVRGVALRDSERRWSSTFEVRGASEASVQRVDFLRLARMNVDNAPTIQLELLRFELIRSVERAGTLELRLNAPDQTGFLAALLEHLAGFVLFPEEIRIETFRSVAEDALFLSSVGGQTPPVEIESALRASLRLCTRNRVPLPPGT